MLSYWEQQSFLQYDRIVVGAGIVGLSTALELRDRFPDDRILMLERGLLPTGASTRNAGFACTGSVTELLDDLRTVPEEAVVDLFMRRKAGLERLRSRLGDTRIGYHESGSHELLTGAEQEALDAIPRFNALLRPVLGHDAFRDASDRIGAFGFNTRLVTGLIESLTEGSLNTGDLLRALTDAAIDARVELKTGAVVTGFEETGSGVDVIVADAVRGTPLRLRGKTLCLCTNAFTKALLPDANMTPGRGQVLVTAPVPGLQLRGIYHYDRGYYYFRELDGRVLLGGGRHRDFAGETSEELVTTETIQTDLEQVLRTIVLPGQEVAIEYRWAGIMAFGPNKSSVVQQITPHVFGAFRCGGMGVALGSETAHQLAQLVAAGTQPGFSQSNLRLPASQECT